MAREARARKAVRPVPAQRLRRQCGRAPQTYGDGPGNGGRGDRRKAGFRQMGTDFLL